MQTVFSWEGWVKKGIIYTCLVFVGACLCYAGALKNAKIMPINTAFSFVVQQCDNVEVGGFETLQMGGAGNIITLDKETYVAVGVYSSKLSAEKVAKSLGDKYFVQTLTPNDLYFCTPSKKKKASVYVGAFQSLDGCMQVLAQEIERLEKGATQTSSKFVVQNLKNQFLYLGEEYKYNFPTFGAVCLQSADTLTALGRDIIYSQKLRRLLCDLSVAYCQLCAEFLP